MAGFGAFEGAMSPVQRRVRRTRPTVIMLVQKAPQRFEAVCVCSDRRDSEGVCDHMRLWLSGLRPWYRQRTTVVQPLAKEKNMIAEKEPTLRCIWCHRPKTPGTEDHRCTVNTSHECSWIPVEAGS